MSFTFDDERDYDRRQEAIAEARERRSPADAMASVLMKTWAKDEAEIAKRDARIAELKAALRELFAEMSRPMHDDPRYRDVTVQIDRETYERVKALLSDVT